MKVFVLISYKGSRYHGWQRQTNTANTVQQIVEEQLTKVLKYKCIISGCGRTDAGVHASQFYFHFDLRSELDFDLCFRMNLALPDDIVFLKLFEVGETNNARFDAIQRIYNYHFHCSPNPFISDISFYQSRELDFSRMLKCLKIIEGQRDFKNFCKQPDKHKTTICHITSVKLFKSENGSRYRFEISANRFLRGMIRIIVSRLFAVGEGRLSIEAFEKSFIEHLPINIKTAYPQGLFLSKVQYPFISEDPNAPSSDVQFIRWKKVD
ncbi:MAG: tRNA pseudouridine(38-40) synthase TruA [Saprospiraceae bacterium]|nr:tRNA pseudouridine(38-40) synthase TruA [Bacteroidia bacterium]NNE13772.1 tRNA pseudouridine(38-40) synthase TruA [Saprospiraceae bacterium]NNL90684.1 tRNA pseudouridine(38-40) synthase TruA [Saprospiraceae bacterium]